jgi:hypothetical protein
MRVLEEIAPAAAQHIIQRMGESGQPPERQALAVNVGTEEILATLRDEYLLPMKEAGRNSSFKLVQAPFGGGKTQFLHCLRELAESLGFATALVGVSPRECPFDDAGRIYRAVARAVALPADDPGLVQRAGLDRLLREVAERRVEEHGKAAFLDWVGDDLAHRDVESRALLRAVCRFLEAVAGNDPDSTELLGDFLLGEDLAPADLAIFRLREKVDGETGFRFLRSLAQVLRHLDLPGLVLLFDEMDRTLSLTKRKKRAIGDNLRQMIDHCGNSVLPSVLLVYAVPPEFMTQVVIEYPALEQRLKRSGELGVRTPLAPVIDLDHLPLPAVKLYEELGRKLLVLYRAAYAPGLDLELQRGNLANLARVMGEDALESGSRRSFVKAALALLSEQHRGGERELTAAEVDRLAGAARVEGRELLPLEGEIEL